MSALSDKQHVRTEFGLWLTNTWEQDKYEVADRIGHDTKFGPPKATEAYTQSELEDQSIIGIYIDSNPL